jgi:molybdate transport system substrate-binding protein
MVAAGAACGASGAVGGGGEGAGGAAVRRGVLRVAAAADLRFALDELVGTFRRDRPGTSVRVTYGSSGTLAAQLANGAPFDLFLSADVSYPERLRAEGLVAPGDVFTYAVGRIVVWVPDRSELDVARLGAGALVAPGVRRIAIANPDHAPYGRAAVAALRSLGLYERVRDRLVHGENVAQAAQFVASGAADVGIIPLSLALAPGAGGRWWEVPADRYPPLVQGGAIMRRAADVAMARAFVALLRGPAGRAVLDRYGFREPR